MVSFIILQTIAQASRPAAETRQSRRVSQPVWSVPFDNMGAERKKAALPGALQQIAGSVSQAKGRPRESPGFAWTLNPALRLAGAGDRR